MIAQKYLPSPILKFALPTFTRPHSALTSEEHKTLAQTAEATGYSTSHISPIALFIALRYGLGVIEEMTQLRLLAATLATERDELSELVRHVLVEEITTEGQLETSLLSPPRYYLLTTKT